MNRKKSLIAVCVFTLMVAVSAFSSVVTANLVRFGPFFTSQVAFDSLTGGQVGGQVRIAITGGSTDSLRIGDVTYWSDTNKVTKSATLALYNAIAGVVVGGARTSDRASISSADVGTLAATSGQRVIILKQGRTWMKNGQNGIMVAGRRLIPSDSIAGRVDSVLTATLIDTFYRMLGRAVTAFPAVGVGLVDVDIK